MFDFILATAADKIHNLLESNIGLISRVAVILPFIQRTMITNNLSFSPTLHFV
jgi:hypothetical protein